MPGRERGKFLFRDCAFDPGKSARAGRARNQDGGKTIKEIARHRSPTGRGAFFYYAGWADKLENTFPGRKARPLGVAGQIIPWIFRC